MVDRPDRTSTRLAPVGQAVLAATAGLVASCGLGVALTAAQHFEIWPFPRIEQVGGDLGARLRWANRLGARGPLQPGFTFIDVDLAACRGFQSEIGCKTDRPVRAALTAAVRLGGIHLDRIAR